MVRRDRRDRPGSWHHVINRAVGRRPLFEDRSDVRYFLSRLAREVRRGSLEVHAWAIMTTHFHLLVRSPEGALSGAMRRAQNQYVRRFNRRHKRDGPLMRGRFLSKPADTEEYRRVLLAYIDHNPVEAGLASKPWTYPWGSAALLVNGAKAPWHERSWVRGIVDGVREPGESFASAYMRRFGRGLDADVWNWLEARIAFRGRSPIGLDQLVATAPEQVLDWMRRKASLADGHPVGAPVGSLQAVLRVASDQARSLTPVGSKGRPIDPGVVLQIAMCRLLASAGWSEIGLAMGRTGHACAASFKRNHHRLLDTNPDYARSVACTARLVVERMVAGEPAGDSTYV